MTSKKLGLFVLAATTLALAACGGTTVQSSSSSKAPVSSSQGGSSSEGTSEKTTSEGTTQSTSEGTSEGTSSGTSEGTSSTSEAPVESVDLFYFDGTFTGPTGQGDEGTGKMVYWFGDGGSVSSASVDGRTFSLTYANAGQWYGVQIFYKLPYAVQNDSYAFDFTLTSDVAGAITVNGVSVTLAAATALNYKATVAQGVGDTINMQLGVNGSGVLAGASFKLTVNSIKDNSASNKYYLNRFENGNEVLKDIQVRDGKTVVAPADPTPATGKIFDGWYDGDTKWTSTLAISAAHTWNAKFADASGAKTVTFMNGTETLGTASVASGSAVAVPSSLVYPFGNTVLGWYSDAALTKAYDLSTAVTADLTLYAKLGTQATGTYMNSDAAGFKIPDANISRGSEGQQIFSGFAGWGQDAWTVQVNFLPIPVGVSGTNYTINFDYKINGAGADVQIYDTTKGASVGTALSLSVVSAWESVSMPFSGASFSDNTKLTFELGKIAASVTVDFEITNFSLKVAA
jgi:hypothetical protein